VKVEDVLVICSFRKESSDNGFVHFVNYSTSTLCSSRRLPLPISDSPSLPISSVSRSLSLQSLFSSLISLLISFFTLGLSSLSVYLDSARRTKEEERRIRKGRGRTGNKEEKEKEEMRSVDQERGKNE
jgi:hypothetical protein